MATWADVLATQTTKVQDKPSHTELLRYYRRYVQDLGTPERRTFRFLISSNRNEAIQGRTARQRGRSWKRVVDRYSMGENLKPFQWRLVNVTRVAVRRSLLGRKGARLAFSAPRHRVVGPFPLQGNWLVFEVVHIAPNFRPSYPEARLAIYNRIVDRRQEVARRSLWQALRAKFLKQTRCAATLGLAWCRRLKM
ncbi:MAG: peptidyl-prolyl cis-trans isomerase [Solirubrobacterales bacterium]